MDSNGALFGTTVFGGASGDGTIFEMTHGSTAITTIASFNGVNGQNPYAGLTLDGSGDLFGIASGGGTSNDGTIFEVVQGTTSITPIASFNGANAEYSSAGLAIDTSGNLFGTTYYGGTSGDGTVFEIVHGTTAIATVASFNGVNGANPGVGVTLDTSGDIFGTIPDDGPTGDGTVFEITTGTNTIQTIASFNGANGSFPYATLTLDSSGDLFGTTRQGGTSGNGAIFEVVNGASAVTLLASFAGAGTPSGLALDAGGNLFGSTAGELGSYGTVFELNHGGGTITTLFSFNNANGANPNGGVIVTSSGDLFGTTANGGTAGDGTVFQLTSAPPTLSFSAPPNPATAGSVIDGSTGVQVAVDYSWGNVIPTDTSTVTLTLSSGVFTTGSNKATATAVNGVATFHNLAINAAGIYTIAATDGPDAPAVSNSFNIFLFNAIASLSPAPNAADPYSSVVLDANGNLFGTTAFGGANGDGTIFEIIHGSTAVTTVASFNGVNGANPYAGLTLDSNGNLFGTASGGGTGNNGTVFEIVHGSNAISAIASFNGVNASFSSAGISVDSSGNLFGTTYTGGSNGDGSVFEISYGTTTIATLASFDGANGKSPSSGVALDAAGDIFGATLNGGTGNLGTVFEIVRGTASISTIGTFVGANGEFPNGLTLDSNGDLFGTTQNGGQFGYGTVFEIVRGTTAVATLTSFNGLTANPGLTLDANNNFFGTIGGNIGYEGAIFELVQGSAAITILTTFDGLNGANPGAGVTVDSSGDVFGTTEG
ncbi:MAG TPA: choice-of-anchor tandem repeat GloVer-containing protein, partial [Humisphaera sp.]|nr:choice-of-anchor tandem repeat GloVer-containing protein [Humisphaera sp.]